MIVSRSIPNGLSRKQTNTVIRDICRSINYESLDKVVARITSTGFVCSGWASLPRWIDIAELRMADSELVLSLSTKFDMDMDFDQVNKLANGLAAQLTDLFNYKTQFFPQKVFCIGWPKTGTTSITQALRTLGLFSWHFSPWVIGCSSFSSDVSKVSLNFDSIAEYDAMADLPICALFRELDMSFPGSKFIFTTRPVGSWINSAISDIENSIDRTGSMHAAVRWAYGIDSIDREVFINRYTLHQKLVSEYFSGRSDILVIELNEENPWQRLCDFLNLPIPDEPFPFLNRRE